MPSHPKTLTIAIGLVVLGLWVALKGETDKPVEITSVPAKPKASLPEVEPVKVPKPVKNTSGVKKPVIQKPASKEPDTNGDGKVDEADKDFTGTTYEYWDEAKTILKSESRYKNGVRHGPQMTYYKIGLTETEIELNKNKKFFKESKGLK